MRPLCKQTCFHLNMGSRLLLFCSCLHTETDNADQSQLTRTCSQAPSVLPTKIKAVQQLSFYVPYNRGEKKTLEKPNSTHNEKPNVFHLHNSPPPPPPKLCTSKTINLISGYFLLGQFQDHAVFFSVPLPLSLYGDGTRSRHTGRGPPPMLLCNTEVLHKYRKLEVGRATMTYMCSILCCGEVAGRGGSSR